MIFSETVIDSGLNSINPMQFGYENCKPSKFYGPAVRTHWLFHYVISGRGIFTANGKTYNLNAGEMFVIEPYIETYYEADSENPWQYIWIGFTTNGKLPLELEPVVHCPEAFSVFEKMKKCAEYENGRTAFLCARLWELFSLLLENKKYETDHIEKALNCIHSEYMNGISVQDIADRLNLNRSYFSMIFKKKMGISPREYLINYRLETAAKLMLEQKKSISVAAYSVGYTDIFNFSKMFKRYYGVSPRKYIEQQSG